MQGGCGGRTPDRSIASDILSAIVILPIPENELCFSLEILTLRSLVWKELILRELILQELILQELILRKLILTFWKEKEFKFGSLQSPGIE